MLRCLRDRAISLVSLKRSDGKGQIGNAIELARRALPNNLAAPERPIAQEAFQALSDAYAKKRYELRNLKAHSDSVNGALQLADGRLLTWSDDKTARLWAADGRLGPVLEGHTGSVSGTLQLADGRLLTWSGDKTARVWAADGTPGPVLEGHSGSVIGALQLADGRLLTCAVVGRRRHARPGAPGPYRLRSLARCNWPTAACSPGARTPPRGCGPPTARPARCSRAIPATVNGAVQLADGRLLTWSEDTTARLWAADGTPGPVLQGHTGYVTGALQLADGRLLTWSCDETARLWAADGRPARCSRAMPGGSMAAATGRRPPADLERGHHRALGPTVVPARSSGATPAWLLARCNWPTAACSHWQEDTRRPRGCGPPTARPARSSRAIPVTVSGRGATGRRPPAHLERRHHRAVVGRRRPPRPGPPGPYRSGSLARCNWPTAACSPGARDKTARLWATDGTPRPGPQGPHRLRSRARCNWPTAACSPGAGTPPRGCGPPTAAPARSSRAIPVGSLGRAATGRRPPAHLERRQDRAVVGDRSRRNCSPGPTA